MGLMRSSKHRRRRSRQTAGYRRGPKPSAAVGLANHRRRCGLRAVRPAGHGDPWARPSREHLAWLRPCARGGAQPDPGARRPRRRLNSHSRRWSASTRRQLAGATGQGPNCWPSCHQTPAPYLPLRRPVQDVQGEPAEVGRDDVAGGEGRVEPPAPIEPTRSEHATAARELAPDGLRRVRGGRIPSRQVRRDCEPVGRRRLRGVPTTRSTGRRRPPRRPR